MDQDKLDTLKTDHPELAETLDKLAGTHPELAVVKTASGKAVFRKPTRPEYKRHLSLLFNEKTRADALEQLARACVVHPDKPTFAQWLEDKPGIPVACADTLTTLAGGAKDEDEGK